VLFVLFVVTLPTTQRHELALSPVALPQKRSEHDSESQKSGRDGQVLCLVPAGNCPQRSGSIAKSSQGRATRLELRHPLGADMRDIQPAAQARFPSG
jgi:hypothetical protein